MRREAAKHIIKPLKRQQNNCIGKIVFNISIETNTVGTDETAPTGAVWSGSTLFVYEASHIVVGDKKTYIL